MPPRSVILRSVANSDDRSLQRTESNEAAWADLANHIAEGVESGPATPMTEADWRAVEAEIRAAATPTPQK